MCVGVRDRSSLSAIAHALRSVCSVRYAFRLRLSETETPRLIAVKQEQSGALAAGAFSRWLRDYLLAQAQAQPAGDVPCGDCNACCRASYFIPIDNDERETIALIPAARLTRSSRSSEPRSALDQSCGERCPMLVDGACSIYSQRPRACRRFDCRVFAAAAVSLGSGPRAAVNNRVWQWRFDYPSELDAACQSAVLAAAAFLQRRADLIHPEVAPSDAAELAKAAVVAYELFLEPCAASVDSDATLAAAINEKLRRLRAVQRSFF